MLYLAILGGALPRNHRKTICSLLREGNTGEGHSKENRTEKIRMVRGLIEKNLNSNFSLSHC